MNVSHVLFAYLADLSCRIHASLHLHQSCDTSITWPRSTWKLHIYVAYCPNWRKFGANTFCFFSLRTIPFRQALTTYLPHHCVCHVILYANHCCGVFHGVKDFLACVKFCSKTNNCWAAEWSRAARDDVFMGSHESCGITVAMPHWHLSALACNIPVCTVMSGPLNVV